LAHIEQNQELQYRKELMSLQEGPRHALKTSQQQHALIHDM